MLELHIKGTAALTVTDEVTAAAVGSGMLPVFATPSMIALMEKAAAESVAPQLDGPRRNRAYGNRRQTAHLYRTRV